MSARGAAFGWLFAAATAASSCVADPAEVDTCIGAALAACPCEGGLGTRACEDGRWGACDCARATPPSARPVGACLCGRGCCGVGACLLGVADEACGADGRACVRCGAGERCVGRACAAPPAGLSLRVVSASVPTFNPAKSDCSDWDNCEFDPSGAAPDVFVRATDGRFRTVTAWNRYDPAWNEIVATGLTADQLAAPIGLDIFDDDHIASEAWDGALPEQLLGHVEVRLRPEQRAPGRLVFTVGDSEATRLTLTLELL